MLKKFSIIFSIILFSISARSQTFDGKITQVIGGRTAVLTAQNGNKTTILLEYLEVPEPEQQLSKTVKEHLEKLVLNKDVRFVSARAYSEGLIGSLFLGDIEINLQMLRDGAAWYDLPQNKTANSEYQKMEALARAEKLGVWAVEGLKPAWEFREERYQKKIEAERAADKAAQSKSAKNQTETIWAEIPKVGSNAVGYQTRYDKFTNVTQVLAYTMLLPTKEDKRRFSLKLSVSHAFYGQDVTKVSGSSYFFTFIGKGVVNTLNSTTDLRLLAGESRLHFDNVDYNGYPSQERNPDTDMIDDIVELRFQMNETEFKEFVKAEQAQFRLGDYQGIISPSQMNSIKNLP